MTLVEHSFEQLLMSLHPSLYYYTYVGLLHQITNMCLDNCLNTYEKKFSYFFHPPSIPYFIIYRQLLAPLSLTTSTAESMLATRTPMRCSRMSLIPSSLNTMDLLLTSNTLLTWMCPRLRVTSMKRHLSSPPGKYKMV